MAIPSDPVLSVEDARANMHAIVAAVGEGREFLVGPRRRPVALISPAARQVPEEGPAVNLVGDPARAMLALAGDAIGFALAEAHAADWGLRLPEDAQVAVPGLNGEAVDVLTAVALEAFHAAGGDPTVTHQDISAALTR